MEPGTFQWCPVPRGSRLLSETAIETEEVPSEQQEMFFLLRRRQSTGTSCSREVVESSLLGDIQKSSGYSRQPVLCVSA